MDSYIIGKGITYYRKRKGLTMSQLAEIAGLSQPTISLYEKGDRTPSDDNLIKIAEALSVPVSRIKEMAESIYIEENQKSRVNNNDEKRKSEIERSIHSLTERNDFLMQLSDSIVLTMNFQIRDLSAEREHRRIAFHRRRSDSPYSALLEKVMVEFLQDNQFELSNRISKELEKTNIKIEDIARNLRDDFYY